MNNLRKRILLFGLIFTFYSVLIEVNEEQPENILFIFNTFCVLKDAIFIDVNLREYENIWLIFLTFSVLKLNSIVFNSEQLENIYSIFFTFFVLIFFKFIDFNEEHRQNI